MEVNSPVNFIVFQNRPSLSRRRTPAQPGRQRHSVPPAIRRTDPSIFHSVNPHHDFCVAAISASGLDHFLPFGWTPMLILVECLLAALLSCSFGWGDSSGYREFREVILTEGICDWNPRILLQSRDDSGAGRFRSVCVRISLVPKISD